MAKPMTAAQREIIRLAMDEPMTDDEAISLIVDVGTLVVALAKIAKPNDQLEMVRTGIRMDKLADYAARRFALAVLASSGGTQCKAGAPASHSREDASDVR